jgi:hypothetical protein
MEPHGVDIEDAVAAQARGEVLRDRIGKLFEGQVIETVHPQDLEVLLDLV